MIFYIAVIILAALDQITKFITVDLLKPVGSVNVIKGILSFTYVENRGAAFGIFQNSRWFFIIASVAAAAAIIWYMQHNKPNGKIIQASLALILSGAIGNLADRIFRGYVVDMIEVTFINYPVFNFADCFVVIGSVLLCIYVIFIYKEAEKDEMPHEKI